MAVRARTRAPGRRVPTWVAVVVLPLVSTLAACTGGDDAPSARLGTPPASSDAPDAPPPPAPLGDPSATLPDPATTPVPAPGGGDVSTEVDAGEQDLLAPVGLEQVVDVDGRMTAQVVEAVRTRGRARIAGEIAGPAIRVTVRLTNTSSRPVSLRGVSVGAHDAGGDVLSALGTRPSRPFRGPVAPGASAEGVYLFSLSTGGSAPFTFAVSYAAAAPVAVFVGDRA